MHARNATIIIKYDDDTVVGHIREFYGGYCYALLLCLVLIRLLLHCCRFKTDRQLHLKHSCSAFFVHLLTRIATKILTHPDFFALQKSIHLTLAECFIIFRFTHI